MKGRGREGGEKEGVNEDRKSKGVIRRGLDGCTEGGGGWKRVR